MDSENGTSEQLKGLIETDAQIQPGDSGGSLVSSDAKIIGIITAGSVSASPTGTRQTTDGYAIPINDAPSPSPRTSVAGKASDTVHIGATAFLGIKVVGAGAGITDQRRRHRTRPPTGRASRRAPRSPRSTAPR